MVHSPRSRRRQCKPASRSSTSTDEFSTPAAYLDLDRAATTTASASPPADFIANELNCQGNVVELQGVPGISVTEQRTKGFTDGIKRCNGGIKIVASQPGRLLA